VSSLRAELEALLPKVLPIGPENGLTESELLGRLRPRLSDSYLATSVLRVVGEFVAAGGPISRRGGLYFRLLNPEVPVEKAPEVVTPPPSLPPSLYSDVCRALRLVLPIGAPNALGREAVLQELEECFPGCNKGTLKGYLHRAITKSSEFGRNAKGYFRTAAATVPELVTDSDIINDAVPTPPAPPRLPPPLPASRSRPLPSAIDRLIRDELVQVCPRTEREAVPRQLLVAHLKARLPSLTPETVELHFRELLRSGPLVRAANGWIYSAGSGGHSEGTPLLVRPGVSEQKRGPGRPRGSKNKPRLSPNALAIVTPRRGPGRPPGSKNKPKASEDRVSTSLRAQLDALLPKVLPRESKNALNGTEMIKRLRPLLVGSFSDNTLRAYLSQAAAMNDSVIAKLEGGHGYYLRAGQPARADPGLHQPLPQSSAAALSPPLAAVAIVGSPAPTVLAAEPQRLPLLKRTAPPTSRPALHQALAEKLSGDERAILEILRVNGSARSSELAARLARNPLRLNGLMRALRRVLYDEGVSLFTDEVLPDGETMYRYLHRESH
jgi:hypothetical protein